MRILIIGEYKPQVCGPAHVVLNLASYLSREHEVSVINMEDPPYPRGLGHWLDGDVQVWQETLWFLNTQTIIQGAIQKTKRAFLLRNHVDLYNAHGPFNALIGLIDRSKPLVLTFHGYSSLETLSKGIIKPKSFKFRVYRWVERRTVQRADAIIAVGTRQKRWIIDELGADPHKIFHVPNGVDLERFNPHDKRDCRNKFDYSPVDDLVIFIKSYSEQSGIRYLLQAIRIINQRRPSIKLMAIGGGQLKEEMSELARSLEIEESVLFLDRVSNEQIPFLLNMADVYISPSIPMGGAEEVFPLGLLEAMACGKPVIATGIGGQKEIIEGGDNVGILIPPSDPGAIADAVIELFCDPEKAKEMGKNARKYVESTYSWENAYKDTVLVYQYAKRMHSKHQFNIPH